MPGPRSRDGDPEARHGRLAAEGGMQVWMEERVSCLGSGKEALLTVRLW